MQNAETTTIAPKMALAALKRAMQVGKTVLTLVESPIYKNSRNLGVPRVIVKKQTNGIFLGKNQNDLPGSFLELKNATLVECDGHELRIYLPGYRPLTEEEQRVFDNMPSKRQENAKLLEVDILTDGSSTYWMDKAWVKKHGMEYLMHEKKRGMLIAYDGDAPRILDEHIRGDLLFRYKIENLG